MREIRSAGAVVVNDFGNILKYSCQATEAQVEERMIELMGKEAWEQAKRIGCKVVNCEIVVFIND